MNEFFEYVFWTVNAEYARKGSFDLQKIFEEAAEVFFGSEETAVQAHNKAFAAEPEPAAKV